MRLVHGCTLAIVGLLVGACSRSPGAALFHARVVGLGEATHGTHESEVWRGALTLQLLSRGFDVIAIETTPAAAARADAYVQEREDDLTAATRGLGPWDTVEMRSLLLALRGRAVHIIGVDVDGPDEGTLQEQIAARDARMAQALLSTLAGHRVVLWAHAAHVERGHVAAVDAPSMGHHLSDALGSSYVPIGVVLGRGTLLARDRTLHRGIFPLPEPEPGSLEGAMDGQPSGALLDAQQWRAPVSYRTMGSVYTPASQHPVIVPAEEFDALVYFARSTAATPL